MLLLAVAVYAASMAAVDGQLVLLALPLLLLPVVDGPRSIAESAANEGFANPACASEGVGAES